MLTDVTRLHKLETPNKSAASGRAAPDSANMDGKIVVIDSLKAEMPASQRELFNQKESQI